MCTIILAHDVVEGMPLLLGANRDEQYERPAAPPRSFDDRSPRVLAPQDLKAGGTWLGINECGVLVAITNRFGAYFGSDRRSRGELVFEALASESVEEAAKSIASLDAREFNGFHLVIASTDDARLVWGDGVRMSASPLPQRGVTVLTERSMGAARNERKRRVKRQVDELATQRELGPDRLEGILADRDDGQLDATCVVMDDIGYGTRSSTILGLGAEPILRYADGPPCNTPFANEDGLLRTFFEVGGT